MSTVTQKQFRFVSYFLETGSKVEAYRRAYNCRRMNERTITRKAQEVASLPHVAELIRQQQAEAMANCAVSLQSTIEALASIAFTSLTEIVEWTGGAASLKPFAQLTPRQRAAIKEVSITPEGALHVKLHDKIRALEALGKHLGIFAKQPANAHKHPVIIMQSMPEPPGNTPSSLRDN